METKYYQEIMECIIDDLPSQWTKLAMYFSFSGSIITHKFYVDTGNGYKDCFCLGYEQSTLRRIFSSIECVLIRERSSLLGKKRWNVFMMTIDSTGKFKVNYDYDDIKDSFVFHQMNWEKELFNQE